MASEASGDAWLALFGSRGRCYAAQQATAITCFSQSILLSERHKVVGADTRRFARVRLRREKCKGTQPHSGGGVNVACRTTSLSTFSSSQWVNMDRQDEQDWFLHPVHRANPCELLFHVVLYF